jgi:hypothetical protein
MQPQPNLNQLTDFLVRLKKTIQNLYSCPQVSADYLTLRIICNFVSFLQILLTKFYFFCTHKRTAVRIYSCSSPTLVCATSGYITQDSV